jgi:urease accessory protein
MSESNMRTQPTVRRTQPVIPCALVAPLLLALLVPTAALAHPGHGEGGFWPGFLHAFQGLDHVLAAVAVGVWGVRLGGRASWALPTAFVSAMAAGMGLAFAGIALPMLEPAIAASVLLLGTLIALDARLTAAAGALIVAIFAPFHSAAHIGEMPAATAILAYAGGLLLSTALLHAAGIVAAQGLRNRPLALRIAAAPVALAGACMIVRAI